MDKLDHLTCHYCGLRHEKVEAGGVWYCPNFLCTGPGGHSHRRKCQSFRDVNGDCHTVDHDEMIARGKVAAYDTEDKAIREAILASVSKWERSDG